MTYNIRDNNALILSNLCKSGVQNSALNVTNSWRWSTGLSVVWRMEKFQSLERGYTEEYSMRQLVY